MQMQKQILYKLAYTMGGATFRIAEVDVENAGYSQQLATLTRRY